MLVGCPKETKNHEYRVGLTPSAVHELTAHGHTVLIQGDAGLGAGFPNSEYANEGAQLVDTAEEVFDRAELVVKVKEPLPEERSLLRAGQTLFTFLHLAADPELTRELLDSGVTAIAYETVTDHRGGLPLLAPMSEVAGRLAPQVGAWALQKINGGRGVLLGGLPGVGPGEVLILGAGTVGTSAARVAAGMGADVIALDRSLDRLRHLDETFSSVFGTRYASRASIEKLLPQADLVIGAVLVPGAAAPKLVRREHLASMKPGAVLVDVAIDQGGCFETSQPTSHDKPIFEIDRIVHYCVTNMPGAVPRTSTIALGNATMAHVVKLADHAWREAMRADQNLLAGLNTHAGKLTNRAVGEAVGIEAVEAAEVLSR